MGIFDKKNSERDENKMDSKKGMAAQNPVSRERDKKQKMSDQVSPSNHSQPIAGKDRSPAPSHKYYEVQEGDSLSGIAKEQYGDAGKWEIIFEANKKEIQDPDKLNPGQMIELPDEGKGEV